MKVFVDVEQDVDEVDNDSSDGDYQPSNLSLSSDGSSDENEEANVSIERGDVSVSTIHKEIPKINTMLQDCQASCTYSDVSSSMTPKLNNYEQIVNSIENLTEAIVCKSKGDAVGIPKRKSGHKMHFCLYCKKRVWNPPRHFMNIHKSEDDVKEALSHPLRSKERSHAWKLITRQGDYLANINLLKDNQNNLFVVRESSAKVMELVPCINCHGMFNAKTLYKHAKNCKPKFLEITSNKNLSSSRAMLGVAVGDKKFGEVHELILSKMKRGDLHLIIRNDNSLLMYAAVEMQKKQKDRYHDIRYSLRCLARILQIFRRNDMQENAVASLLVLPENFDLITSAVKILSEYNGPRDIGKPNTFLKAGFCLRNLALTVRALALRENCNIKIEKIRNFLELYDSDWQVMAGNARSTYESDKANQPEELPLEGDIMILRKHILDEMRDCVYRIESSSFSNKDVKQLAKLTLTRVLTFNARRGGEVSKLKLLQWQGVEDGRWKRRTDIDNLDDLVEKILADRMQVCYIEGKNKKGKSKNALVPILFTSEMIEAIRLIVKHRLYLEAHDSNPYVFAYGEFYLKGWDTLQSITKSVSNLQKPRLITPTRTRKLLATMMQLLDMNDAELTWLTNHFGHTKDVHMNWYRKEDATIELTKVAKVLVAIDDGKSVKNKKIDDVLKENNRVLENNSHVVSASMGKQSEKRKQYTPNNNCEDMLKPIKKKKTWETWTEEENDAINKAFRAHLLQKKIPQLHEVLLAIKNFPILEKRGHKKIKDKVRNNILRM
ncbi:uncharacterized protein LOC136074327 [Hydra vulgaris]|uniref:Uncharacterized protein LOC136074327 n=1 Tax=Hydra vulgaris TaxID=6087 RepID=A0ABM4B1R7_HYDVU